MKCTGIVHHKDGVILSAIAINYSGKLIEVPTNNTLIFSSMQNMLKYILTVSAENNISYGCYSLFEKPIYNILFFDMKNPAGDYDKYPLIER